MEPTDQLSKSAASPIEHEQGSAPAPPAPTLPPAPPRRFSRPARTQPRNGASIGARLPALIRARPSLKPVEGLPEENGDAEPIHEGELGREARERDALLRRLLAVADMFSAALAVNLAILAGGATPTPIVLATLPLIVLVGKLLGLYDRDEHVLHKSTLDEAPALLNVAIVFMLVAWLLDNALASSWLNKAQLLLMAALLFVFMGLARTLARRIAVRRAASERLLVLGSEPEAVRISEKISHVGALKGEVVGRVALTHEARDARGEDVLGILQELDFVLRRHRIDRVVICPPGEISGEMLDTIRLVKELGVKVSVVPRLFEVIGSSVEFDEIGGLTLLGLRRYDLAKSTEFLKRAFDVTGAAAGLLLLAPAMAVIALVVRFSSAGPVFFRQPRVGRGGETFDMLKFRTMYDGADLQKEGLLHRNEADGFFKIAADPRVTPIGRWLRRTSLDELPQLINVLRGEMSIVGPRPERPIFVDQFVKQYPRYAERHLVSPGITGWAQVYGKRVVGFDDVPAKLRGDLFYVENWSLFMDVAVCLKTAAEVLFHRAA
jgi:exopolysaccharide biosynthesis polyprenyl glycosylphosphotransferase